MLTTRLLTASVDLHVFVLFFSTMFVNGCRKKSGYQHSLKYNLLCSTEERNSYRFGTAWGWGSTDNL